jgi:hypothetical protein
VHDYNSDDDDDDKGSNNNNNNNNNNSLLGMGNFHKMRTVSGVRLKL